MRFLRKHNWKYVHKRLGTEFFEGVEMPRFERAYRICTKCGKAQECSVNFYSETSWYDLDGVRKRILMRNLVDKGDHYYFRPTKTKNVNIEGRLKQLIVDKALIFDNIKLSSGNQSNYYIDARTVTTTIPGARLAAKAMKNVIGQVDAVGGPSIGAVPILGALAGLGFYRTFIVRKEPKRHGLYKWIEGQLTKDDKQIAIIDDVATTGQSLLKAIQVVKEHFPHVNIAKVVALVDREEGAKEKLAENGYQLTSIFTAHQLTVSQGHQKEKEATNASC